MGCTCSTSLPRALSLLGRKDRLPELDHYVYISTFVYVVYMRFGDK